jgi:hypothetical protein
MKTIIISLLTIIASLIFGSSNAKPIRDIISLKEPALQVEEYIDDIPFNTERIAAESMLKRTGWEYGEEANVDDIPFDTRSIANKELLCRMICKSMQEAEVSDIPFDTRKIYEECLLARMQKSYESEQPADDIRFDTRCIASDLLFANSVENFRNEAEVDDIPYETVCIISTVYNNEPAYVVVKKRSGRKSNRSGQAAQYEYTIYQPCHIEVSAPVPVHNTLTRELPVMPGSSL